MYIATILASFISYLFLSSSSLLLFFFFLVSPGLSMKISTSLCIVTVTFLLLILLLCLFLFSSSFFSSFCLCCRFVLFAEGKRASDKKTREQYARPSVESVLEKFLDDLSFPCDYLKKGIQGNVDITGQIKFFINLTHKGRRERTRLNSKRENTTEFENKNTRKG